MKPAKEFKDPLERAKQTTALFGIFIFVLIEMSCRKPLEGKCNVKDPLYARVTFPIGTAVDNFFLQSDSIYQVISNSQFNSFTPENIFKPAYLHPEEDVYYWEDADFLAQYCRARNKRIHGHTLIWHQQNPQWMSDFSGTSQDWDVMMKKHIISIVTHFGSTVSSWDVVNEAFNEDGSLRDNIWLQHIGPSYIEKAFQYAREANTHVKLFYNDYGLESNPTKLNAVLHFFNNMRQRGVSVDGIGLQMHINIKYSEIYLIEKAIQKVAEQNYLLHLSELDISVNPMGKTYKLLENDLKSQAELLCKVVRAYKNVPTQLQFGITFWGISDRDSWIRTYYNRVDYPLLFDDNFQPKPAYCFLKNNL
jgi:endo-1,4-beta-xylanase